MTLASDYKSAFLAVLVLITLVSCSEQGDSSSVWSGTIETPTGETIDIVYNREEVGDSLVYSIDIPGRPDNGMGMLYDFNVFRDTTQLQNFVRFKVMNPLGQEEDCVLPEQPNGSYRGPCVSGISDASTFTIWPPGVKEAYEKATQ